MLWVSCILAAHRFTASCDCLAHPFQSTRLRSAAIASLPPMSYPSANMPVATNPAAINLAAVFISRDKQLSRLLPRSGKQSPNDRPWAAAVGRVCREMVVCSPAGMNQTSRLADIRSGRLAPSRSSFQTEMLASRSGDGIRPTLIVYRPLRWRRPANACFFAMAAACTCQHSDPCNDCERTSHSGIIAPDALWRQVGGSGHWLVA